MFQIGTTVLNTYSLHEVATDLLQRVMPDSTTMDEMAHT